MALFGKEDESVMETEVFEEAFEEEPRVGDFAVGDKAYDIRYNQKQLRLYEASHPPIMATFTMYNGMLSYADLTAILAYGLCEHGKGFVAPKAGMSMAERIIEANGYPVVLERVIEAIQRDLGFLFGAEA